MTYYEFYLAAALTGAANSNPCAPDEENPRLALLINRASAIALHAAERTIHNPDDNILLSVRTFEE